MRGALPSRCSTGHSTGNSALLPAYGHVAMGAGSGRQAVQVNQNFPGNNNHMRSDVTAFTGPASKAFSWCGSTMRRAKKQFLIIY